MGFLVTLVLFLATSGAVGFYVLKTRERKEFRQPTPAFTPVPILTPIPTPTPRLPAISPIPTFEPVAGWETYTNAKYQFSFRFPEAWVVDDRSTGALFRDRSGQGVLTINIFPNIRYGPKGEYLSEEEVMKQLASTRTPQTKIDIGGEEGLISSNEQQSIQTAVFAHNEEGYLFLFQTSKEAPRSLFTQILSTFRFL